MLKDASFFSKVYIACGYTDLRLGIDGLSTLIKNEFKLDPFEKNVLFLFCGRKPDRIKGLLWEGDGFLLLYKRLERSKFQWPRNPEEVSELKPEQYTWLMQGLSIYQKKLIQEVEHKPRYTA